jgi:aspartyl-tRNA(Asn)/glutamyl-tRNA(Gln) amidotransferase subunit B
MVVDGKSPADAVQGKGKADAGAIEDACKGAIAANPKAVADFKAGKEVALKSLIGGVMKLTKGRADAKLAEELLRKLLA